MAEFYATNHTSKGLFRTNWHITDIKERCPDHDNKNFTYSKEA